MDKLEINVELVDEALLERFAELENLHAYHQGKVALGVGTRCQG